MGSSLVECMDPTQAPLQHGAFKATRFSPIRVHQHLLHPPTALPATLTPYSYDIACYWGYNAAHSLYYAVVSMRRKPRHPVGGPGFVSALAHFGLHPTP